MATSTNCNKCGRPMVYAKENKCNYCDSCMNEYCGCKLGRIKEIDPTCDSTAVIPSITVQSVEGITNLANCLVHVEDINTTFYVDDKHRVMITWAGPVDIPGYDMENNPNGYRDQILTDIERGLAVIYDKHGKGYTFGIYDSLDSDGAVTQAINDKLDEMATDGTLESIIATYMDDVAHVFDTVADMKASTELANGSYARTLGFHSLNDGGGALYKITDSGTADEMEIISIGTALYANLIKPIVANPEIYGAYGDGVHDDTNAIQKAIDTDMPVKMTKHYLINNTINIGNHNPSLSGGYKKNLVIDASSSTISYTGSDGAVSISGVNGGRIDFGTINADAGNCINMSTSNGNVRLAYIELSFMELSPLDKGIYINSTGTGFANELRITGGTIQSGNYGIYINDSHENSLTYYSNGNEFDNVCFEGCDVGFYFNIPDRYITGYRFYNTRYVENVTSKLMEIHGAVRDFEFDSWGRLYEDRLDFTDAEVRRTTFNCPVVDRDTQNQIADGIYYNYPDTNHIYFNTKYTSKILTKEASATNGNVVAIRQGNLVVLSFVDLRVSSASATIVKAENNPFKYPRRIFGTICTNNHNVGRITLEDTGEIKFDTEAGNLNEDFYGQLVYETYSPNPAS